MAFMNAVSIVSYFLVRTCMDFLKNMLIYIRPLNILQRKYRIIKCHFNNYYSVFFQNSYDRKDGTAK